MNLDPQAGVLPEALEGFGDNTFHACLTDCPYGLSGTPSPEVITAWLAGEKPKHSAGFLSRTWDSLPPPPVFWRELLRVLRPGATVIAFGGDRTFGLQDIAMRFGGFEILPAFAWLHAEAQAHGGNVGKLADKAAGAEREVAGESPDSSANRTRPSMGFAPDDPHGWIGNAEGRRYVTAPAAPLARLFDGHHSRLRGNYEPILVGRKPLDGTLAQNAERWDVAGFNVEGGRVPTAGAVDEAEYLRKFTSTTGLSPNRDIHDHGHGPRLNSHSDRGRYPSTVLITHHVDCHPDRCGPKCPAAVLAEQGGDRQKSAGSCGVGRPGLNEGEGRSGRSDAGQDVGYGDTGSCARFYFQARPARRERSAGCEGLFWRRAPDHPDGWALCSEADDYAREKDGRPLGNPHGSIKSLELTRYLARLLLQPGPDAKILVPFSGSGSEAIGAMLAGWPHVTAIEQSPQWVEVNRRRAAFWQPLAELGARDAKIGELLGEFHEKLPPVAGDARQGSLFSGDRRP